MKLVLLTKSRLEFLNPLLNNSIITLFQEPQIFSDGSQSWLVAIIIVVLVCVLVMFIIIIKCCCRNGLPKRKYIKKEDELTSTRPDILHPSLSFDQKMTSLGHTDHLVSSPTTDLYSQQSGSGSGSGSHGHQYCEQSSNDSGNRASVNSQVKSHYKVSSKMFLILDVILNVHT